MQRVSDDHVRIPAHTGARIIRRHRRRRHHLTGHLTRNGPHRYRTRRRRGIISLGRYCRVGHRQRLGRDLAGRRPVGQAVIGRPPAAGAVVQCISDDHVGIPAHISARIIRRRPRRRHRFRRHKPGKGSHGYRTCRIGPIVNLGGNRRVGHRQRPGGDLAGSRVGPLVIRVDDDRHDAVAARVDRGAGAAVVGHADREVRRGRGHGDGLGRAVIGVAQIADLDRGRDRLRVVEHRKLTERRQVRPCHRRGVEPATRPIPTGVLVAADLRVRQPVLRQDQVRHVVVPRGRDGPVDLRAVRARGVRGIGIDSVHLDGRQRVRARQAGHVNLQAHAIVARQAEVIIRGRAHSLGLADDAQVAQLGHLDVVARLGLNQRGAGRHRQTAKPGRSSQRQVLLHAAIEGDAVVVVVEVAVVGEVAADRDVAGQFQRAFGVNEHIPVVAGADELALGEGELLGRLELAGGGDGVGGRVLVHGQLVEGELAGGAGGEHLIGAAGQLHRAGAGSEGAGVGEIAADLEGVRAQVACAGDR